MLFELHSFWRTSSDNGLADSSSDTCGVYFDQRGQLHFVSQNSYPCPVVRPLTFGSVSPSIYAVFESLGATDLCGQKGSIYLNKTLAFDPTELSTGRYMWAASDDYMNKYACSGMSDKWQSFNYKDAEYVPPSMANTGYAHRTQNIE